MRVGVVGAGISGLSVAQALARRGHEVQVFERANSVGGLIAACDLAGDRVERFYHFLCRGDDGYVALCRELGLERGLRWRRTRTGFYCEGKEYPFSSALDLLRFSPIPFPQRIRFGLLALEARWRNEWRQLDAIAAVPWLINRVGRRAYDVIWRPLLALKFGERHGQISAAWVWHRLHRVARSKGRLGYLEGGSAALLDALLTDLGEHGAQIHTGRAVEKVLLENGRIRGLRLAGGSETRCERVVSTVPLRVLADLLPPECRDYANALRRIEYIGVVCAVMKLTRRISHNFWLNVHDARVPSNGIIELTNLNPNAATDGTHIAYVPFYLPTSSELYQSPDDAVFEVSRHALECIRPDLKRSDVVSYRVFREPFAQAVCPTGFLELLPEHRAPISGLHLLDSAFLYPEDRTQSGLILRARARAAEIDRRP